MRSIATRYATATSAAWRRPELAGRVVTSFTIATTGRVLGSAVTDSSLRAPDVERCIAEAVRRWEFPSTQQMANVSYPFVLTPPR